MLSSDAGISSMPSSMISNISETDHNSSTTMIATNNSSHHQEYGNLSSFQGRDTKLDKFLAKKDQHDQKKLFYSVIIHSAEPTKIGEDFRK